MKTWKLVLSMFAAATLFSCSTSDKKVEVDPCADLSKLTKSCLEGTWEMSASTYAKIEAARTPDVHTGFSLDATPPGKGVYTLKFTANNDSPTAPEQVVFHRVYENNLGETTATGQYAISADGTALVITGTNGQDGSFDGVHKASIVASDTTGNVLKFSTSSPIFTEASHYLTTTLEYFYKAK